MPFSVRLSASHSTPGEQDGTVHGRAVTFCTPAFVCTWRLSVLNAPEPTLYRSVSEPVSMVSQPSAVFVVNGGAGKESRPIALNVGASTKCASPAYSVRTSVGD